jgi:hypothetical protein
MPTPRPQEERRQQPPIPRPAGRRRHRPRRPYPTRPRRERSRRTAATQRHSRSMAEDGSRLPSRSNCRTAAAEPSQCRRPSWRHPIRQCLAARSSPRRPTTSAGERCRAHRIRSRASRCHRTESGTHCHRLHRNHRGCRHLRPIPAREGEFHPEGASAMRLLSGRRRSRTFHQPMCRQRRRALQHHHRTRYHRRDPCHQP